MLQRLSFSEDTANCFTGTCGIDSLEEIAYLDGVDDVDTTIKGVKSPGGTVTTGSGAYQLLHVKMASLFQSGLLQT
jgi:hypothetical protein